MLGLSEHSRQVVLDRIASVKSRIEHLRTRSDAADLKAEIEIAHCEKHLEELRALLRSGVRTQE